MKSIYASTLISQVIWQDFIAHFKSETTKGSYESDINEIMEYMKMDFLDIRETEVKEYFDVLTKRVEQGKLSAGTMAKKFRELHSYAEYICENREKYKVDENYLDAYYPYLRLVAKQEAYVRSVPLEHLDRLFVAAEDDLMVYCILTLLYRVGLSSTEIIELTPEDFGVYDNGVYVQVAGRREACFISEDVAEILERYLKERAEQPYLFYNRRGNRLNTMYISRMLKKYTTLAEIPSYSAESIRNTCGATMFAYGADEGQTAEQMGVTKMQIKRYKGILYKRDLQKEASHLVKIKIMMPGRN